MWDLVGNPEDRFSQNEAHISKIIICITIFSDDICSIKRAYSSDRFVKSNRPFYTDTPYEKVFVLLLIIDLSARHLSIPRCIQLQQAFLAVKWTERYVEYPCVC